MQSMRASGARTGRREHGQVLVIFTLFIVVLLGATALTVDYGTWLSARRDYQAVSDAAALAGAHYLVPPDSDNPGSCGTAAACARADAWKYLSAHLGLGLSAATIGSSYANINTGPSGTTVGAYRIWVDTPPSAAGAAYPGTLGSNDRVIFVKIQATQLPYFARVMGVNGVTVPAWATASTFPARFAVITLRRGNDAGAIDDGPSNAGDIRLAGSNSKLNVVNGDVGGNWSMVLNSSTTLRMYNTTGSLYQPAPYLMVWTSCNSSCWQNSQVVDGADNSLSTQFPPNGAVQLPGFIQDPNYAPPLGLAANAPNGPVGGSPGIPAGDAGGSPTITGGTIINDGGGNPLTCAPSSPHIGPGWYSSITVKNNGCLILDATHRYADPTNPAAATPVPSTQRPGIFYVTGDFNVTQGMVVGDGVTVIMRPSNLSSGSHQFNPTSHAIIDLNTGKVIPTATLKGEILGAWTTKGASPYSWTGTAWAYQGSQESNMNQYGRGIAIYILKPAQFMTSPAVDANSYLIQVSSDSGLAWSGVTYAPHDNVTIAGQPSHDGVGQLVAWTFTFNGGTSVTQYYDGPTIGYPILLEPCVSSTGGACSAS